MATRGIERILWVYWEMPRGMHTLPPHIALCRRIMEQMARDYTLKVVTPENVRNYIPDLPARVFRVSLAPNGRVERYFRRAARRARAIAVRADYIRAFLLEKYGGLYVDSDAIILGDLQTYFDRLERAGFLVTRRSSFGKSHASVGFYGSVGGGEIIREYATAMRQRLQCNLDHDWNEVGATLLTSIVDRHRGEVAEVSEEEVQPITFEEADQKFASTSIDPDDVITARTRIFMLYSGPFQKSLAGLDEEELFRSDRLISKIFRRALGSRAQSASVAALASSRSRAAFG